MNKQKIMKFLSYLANDNIFIYSVFVVFSLLLAVSIWLFFPVSSSNIHYYSLGLYFLLAIDIAIFISYKKDLSVPLIKTVLKKEYHRIKFKHCKKSRKPVLARVYLKTLSYLMLLFKSSKDSFEVLKEDVFVELSELASKIKIRKKKQPIVPIFIRVCLGILGYIISIFKYITLLFKSSGDNFNLLSDSIFVKFDKLVDEVNKDGVEDKFMAIRQTIDKIKNEEKIDKDSLEELEKELFEFNKIKQKKATVFSLTAITALIITTVTAGLISSFLFPEVFKTKAASYGFLQTSWAGGASSEPATHSDQTGWTKYFSKDNVSTTTPTELKLSLTTTTIFTQTSDSDWQTHATSSTYYSGGSVGILRPNGATCSGNVECSSGFCVDGYCCNNGCTSTCQACNVSGSNGTCANIPTGTDPANECSAFASCTSYIYGWSGNSCVKYSGESANSGDCNGAGACYETATDSCSGIGSTSASCGSSGCLNACVAGELATSYDSVSEICYTDGATHSCSGCQVCSVTGTCGTMAECLVGDAVGAACGGGIKFAEGLVAMPSGCADDTSEPACSGTDIVTKQWAVSGYDQSADSLTAGLTNTNSLVADARTVNPAAAHCSSLVNKCYSDWYLPAKSQLTTLYGQKATLGGFAENHYWSSTEDYAGNPSYGAWSKYFPNGGDYNNSKQFSYYVRCIRSY